MAGYQHAMYARFGRENVKFFNGIVLVRGVSRGGNIVWNFMGHVQA